MRHPQITASNYGTKYLFCFSHWITISPYRDLPEGTSWNSISFGPPFFFLSLRTPWVFSATLSIPHKTGFTLEARLIRSLRRNLLLNQHTFLLFMFVGDLEVIINLISPTTFWYWNLDTGVRRWWGEKNISLMTNKPTLKTMALDPWPQLSFSILLNSQI